MSHVLRPSVGYPIANEDCDWWAVEVRTHDDEFRLRAARAILYEADPDCIAWRNHEDQAVAHLAAVLKPDFLREHTTENVYDEEGNGSYECGCEDVGWFCPDADGEPLPFFVASKDQIDAASYAGNDKGRAS